jgi:hypothetical protein
MLQYYNNITKTLKIPCEFNEVLKDIPDDTEIIIFDEYYQYDKYSTFNQEIKENVLPNNLHTLTFGSDFNQEIKENVLPGNLHTLILGYNFNQEIKENVLPGNLHTLIFNWKFNQEIKKNVLPGNLHTLIFGRTFNKVIQKNVLPKSIKKIGLYSDCNLINNLPLWIEEVCIKFSNYDKHNKEVNNLPMTLKKITVENEYYLKYITKIPFGCEIVIQKIE